MQPKRKLTGEVLQMHHQPTGITDIKLSAMPLHHYRVFVTVNNKPINVGGHSAAVNYDTIIPQNPIQETVNLGLLCLELKVKTAKYDSNTKIHIQQGTGRSSAFKSPVNCTL